MSESLFLDLAIAVVWGAAGAAAGYALAPLVGLVRPYEPVPEDDAPPPRPACPHCAAPVPWARCSPLPLRLLWSRSCPDCRRSLPRTAAAAVVPSTAALFGLLGVRFGLGLELVAFSCLAAVGTVLTAIDLRTLRLPNPFVLPMYPLGLLLLTAAALLPGAAGGSGPAAAGLPGALIGMAGAAAFYGLLWVIHPAGMGWGDVKFSGVLGLYLGWLGVSYVVAGIFAAFLSAAVVGLLFMAAGRATRKTELPHGPFMFGGALLVIVAGHTFPPVAG